jgi:hypothetical protein
LPAGTLYNARMRFLKLLNFRRLSLSLLWFSLSSLLAVPALAQSFSYDTAYPGVNYSAGPLSDRFTRLMQDIEAGRITLSHEADGRGYLDSMLEALDIDPDSQFLVFSDTALKTRLVNANTPRALYFNDDTYVGFNPGSRSIEIAAMDPLLGPVFFDFSQDPEHIEMEREVNQCLRCHDSYSMSGGGVPRFLLSSVLANPEGEIVTHEISIVTDTSTPLNRRWGGMYVTGRHGNQETLGNFVIDDVSRLTNLNLSANGNKDDLSEFLDTTPYISNGSDIVGLMVLEHQLEVQNRLTRVIFESRTLLHQEGQIDEDVLKMLIQPLLESLFMVHEITLIDTIIGDSGFTERFQKLGVSDTRGRSLRELDLQTRTFTYPFSYLIYSEAIEALPVQVKAKLFEGIREVLAGQSTEPVFDRLTVGERESVAAILLDTKPEIFQ